MLTAKCLAPQTALFIFQYQPGRLFPAPPTTHSMLTWLNHEPSTAPSNTQEKNGLARTHTINLPNAASRFPHHRLPLFAAERSGEIRLVTEWDIHTIARQRVWIGCDLHSFYIR